MQKLDRETKIFIYIVLSINGVIVFFASIGIISAMLFGIFVLCDFEPTEQLAIKALIPSTVIGFIITYYLIRERYRIFKDRSGLY